MLSIGRVVNLRGTRGELKIRITPEICPGELQRIFLGKKGSQKEFAVAYIKPFKRTHILKLESINSIHEAEEWLGADILVPEGSLGPLEKGSFYDFQLIGCSVLTLERTSVGLIKGILSAGENDILVVERKGREVLIPFTQAICREVDLDRNEILIDPPEGLLELNEV